jgi:predicted  nucleic acid-binding Zn-ribbon protein
MSQISAFVTDPTDTFSILHDEIQRLRQELEQCRRTHVADDSVGKVKKKIKELEEANSKLQQAEAENKKLTEALSQLHDEHKSKTKLFGDLQKQLQQSMEKLQKIEAEQQELQKSLTESKQKVTDLQKENKKLQENKTAQEEQLQEKNVENKNLTHANQKLEKNNKELEERVQAIEASNTELKQSDDNLQRQLKKLQSALAEEKSAKDAAVTKSEELEKDLEKSLSAEKATRAALEKAKAETYTLFQERHSLSDKVEALKEDVATVTAEREKEKSAKHAAVTKSEELEKELEKSLSAEKATRAALEKAKAETYTLFQERHSLSDKVEALKEDVATVTAEREKEKSARDAAVTKSEELEKELSAEKATRATFQARLSAALEKAKADTDTLFQERDSLSDQVEALKEDVATVSAEREKEKSAKHAAVTKSEELEKELEKSLSAEKATRAAADGRVAALERDVAAVQSELEEARKAAADTRANLGGQSAQLSEALEKAKAETRTLIHQRDSLSDEVDGLKKKNTLLEGQVLKTKGEPWAEQKLVFVNTIRMLLQQRMNYLKKPEKFSDEKTKQDKIALLAEQIRDNDKAIEPERKELKLWIDAQVAKGVHDREANLLQIIDELKNHNGVRSPEENSHEESTLHSDASDQRSGEQVSAQSESSWNLSSNSSEGEENEPGTGKPMRSRWQASKHGNAPGTGKPMRSRWPASKHGNAPGTGKPMRSRGSASKHGNAPGTRKPMHSRETASKHMANPRPGNQHMVSPSLNPAAVRPDAPLTDAEKIYVRQAMDSTVDFTERMKAITTALKKLGLSTNLNQFLEKVENAKKDLSTGNKQVTAAISLRKLCWQFQQMLKQKLSNSEFSPQREEVAATVLEVDIQWGVKQNNFEINVEKRVTYIKHIFDLAISLLSKFETDEKFQDAVNDLNLLPLWNKIAHHLAIARVFHVQIDHLDYYDGSLTDLSNEIRRELQDFKEACKKKIEQYANAGEDWVETLETVKKIIDPFDIPEKGLDDLKEMRLEEHEDLSAHFGVNFNPYILPESLFLNTKYY